jgi:uncharacterized membrane protein
LAHDTTAPSLGSSREHVIIERVLRFGLGAASSLMLVGLILRAVEHETGAPPAPLGHLVRAGDTGSSVTAIGILVLAITPIARVVGLAILWAKERDWRFVAVALSVLAMLGVSIYVGKG